MLWKVLGAVMVFLPCGVSGAAGVLTHTAEPLWYLQTLCEQSPAGKWGAPGNPESAEAGTLHIWLGPQLERG